MWLVTLGMLINLYDTTMHLYNKNEINHRKHATDHTIFVWQFNQERFIFMKVITFVIPL